MSGQSYQFTSWDEFFAATGDDGLEPPADFDHDEPEPASVGVVKVARTVRRKDADWLTPPAVADLLGVTPETVVGWIRSGELQAINLASKTSRRPRFRVSREAMEAFQRARAVATPERTKPRRSPRKKNDPEFVQYF